MKLFIQKHYYLFSICILVLSLLGAFLLNTCIGRFIVAILLIGLMTYLNISETYFFKLKNTLKTFICGLPLLVIVLLGNIIDIMQTENLKWDKVPTLQEVILFVITMLGVGLFEESLMRGTLFNTLFASLKHKNNGMLKAAIISSSFFGILHILNFFENPALKLQTLSQIIYACFIGIYFCGLYVKNKNFIGLVLMHALIDLLSEGRALFSSSISQQMMQDTDPISALVQTLICLPLLYLGIKYIQQAAASPSATFSPNK